MLESMTDDNSLLLRELRCSGSIAAKITKVCSSGPALLLKFDNGRKQ
ncbi:hypothetical protein H0178_22490 [Cytobacillus firmus]|nr:hypothetical protein [Cytobacillus firmus]